MSGFLSQCIKSVTQRRRAEESSAGREHFMRGESYLKQFQDIREGQNRLELAINAFTQASELDSSPEILVQLARAYILNGQLDKAETTIEKVLQRYTPALPPSSGKGEDSHTDKSLSRYIYIKALEAKAFLYFYREQYQKACETLRQALKYERVGRTSKIHMALAAIQMEMMREKVSLQGWLPCFMHGFLGVCFMPVRELLFDMKTALSLILVLLLKGFRTQEQTLEAYLKLYKAYPGWAYVCIEIGKIYYRDELFADAEFWFCKALYRYPSWNEGYQYLANLYKSTNNTEQLIDILRKWLLIRPNSGEIMLVLSQALSQEIETYNEAVNFARQALLLIKEPVMLANAYTHVGNLYNGIHASDAAITAYQAATNICPNNIDTHVQLGTLYYERHEFVLSQRVFEKALALSPRNAKILCNLGYLAWMQDNISQALKYYHQSIALDPTYDIALNNLGVLYLDHVGDVHKAMTLFEQAMLSNPDYALCHYNKGRALSFLGKTVEAARCFMHAQDLNRRTNELDNGELTDRIKQLFENL